MDFVVDASVAISWLLIDEHNVEAEVLLERLAIVTGHVPPLFWHEMQHVLLKAERRGRSKPGETEAFMRRLRRLRLAVSQPGPDETILGLARANRLTAYDAAYLDLAIALSLPLATADRQLADAARLEGVAVMGPLAP